MAPTAEMLAGLPTAHSFLPGMYAMTLMPLLSWTLVTLRLAELGFLGAWIRNINIDNMMMMAWRRGITNQHGQRLKHVKLDCRNSEEQLGGATRKRTKSTRMAA